MTRLIALLVTLWLLPSQLAFACVCEEPKEPLETYVASLLEKSEAVGVFAVGDFRFERGRWAVLQPQHMFKGSPSELRAHAPVSLIRTDCDVRYRKGDLFLVYAGSGEALHLSMCSHSGYLMSRFQHIPILFRLVKELSSP